jgi:hypothetical protein
MYSFELNLLPSMATPASVSKPILRHNSTNWAQTFLIAGALSLRWRFFILSLLNAIDKAHRQA